MRRCERAAEPSAHPGAEVVAAVVVRDPGALRAWPPWGRRRHAGRDWQQLPCGTFLVTQEWPRGGAVVAARTGSDASKPLLCESRRNGSR